MAQSSFALMTNLGRSKEADALANGKTIQITHIAIGDGATVPSGGETALYHEVARKTISGHGTVVGASNVAYFDIYLAAGDGPFTITEAGLYDSVGDLIAIAWYSPPINKPVPASGQTVEGTIRLEVAFSDVASVTVKVDPAMQVALQRLTLLPWIPVVSMTVMAPPAGPVSGDTYLIPAGATGSWAGHAGKIAEFTTAGWAIITPRDGHGVCLPDGRLFVRRGNAYTEYAASLTERGLVELATGTETRAGLDGQRAVTPSGLWEALRSGQYATAAGTADEITTTLTPPLTSYFAGLVIALAITADNTGVVTLDVDGLGPKSVRYTSHNLGLVAGALKDKHVALLVYNGVNFVCLNPIATAASRGLVELATGGEAIAGTDSERAVTPAALAALTATEDRRGLVEMATSAEAVAGVDAARATTPAGVVEAIRSGFYATAGGTANALTAALVPPLTEYRTGLVVAVRAASDNTGAATLNINGLGAKEIRGSLSNLGLSGGELKTNHTALFVYTGAVFALLNPISNERIAGLTELATVAEAVAGVDNERAVTPAGLKAVVDSPIPPNGQTRILKMEYEYDNTLYTRTGTAFGAVSGLFSVAPSVPNSKLLVMWRVAKRVINTAGADSARGDCAIHYFSGTEYKAIEFDSELGGKAVEVGQEMFGSATLTALLDNAHKRSDTGVWAVRLYGQTNAASGEQLDVRNSSVIMIELVGAI